MKVYPLHNTNEVEYDGMMTNGVYLHGKLEEDFGYDLCWIPFYGCTAPYKTGINEHFKIEVDGKDCDVIVYVWQGKRDNTEIYEYANEIDKIIKDKVDGKTWWKVRDTMTKLLAEASDFSRISEGYHGLVCYADDVEANEYAKKKYEEQPSHI